MSATLDGTLRACRQSGMDVVQASKTTYKIANEDPKALLTALDTAHYDIFPTSWQPLILAAGIQMKDQQGAEQIARHLAVELLVKVYRKTIDVKQYHAIWEREYVQRTRIQSLQPTAASGGFTTEYDALINAAAKTHRIRPELLFAQIAQESRFNPNAVSRVGAVGLMQLMPDTAKDLKLKDIEGKGDERYDPVKNIDAGAKYLSGRLEEYNGNEELALAAYNAGPGNVKKYNYAIPPFTQTQHYVKTILANDDKYLPVQLPPELQQIYVGTQAAIAQAAQLARAGDTKTAHTVMNNQIWRISQIIPKLDPKQNAGLIAYLQRQLAYYHMGILPGAKTPAAGTSLTKSTPALVAPATPVKAATPAAVKPAAPAAPAAKRTATIPTWKQQGLNNYYTLSTQFAPVTKAADATRYNGEVLYDLTGKAVKARPGTTTATIAAYYHTVNALKGRTVVPQGLLVPQPARRNGGIVSTSQRIAIPVSEWNKKYTGGRIRVTATDGRLNPVALSRLEVAVRELTRRGYSVTITSANRTYSYQKKLYDDYISGRTIDPDKSYS